jgi:hypothetical protein
MERPLLSQLFCRLLPRDSIRDRVEQSISRGTGLRKSECVLDRHPIDVDVMAATTEAMLSWSRDCIAETRRPYGIDQMALAVACAEPGATPLASASFGVFRPVEFYEDGGVADRVTAFMQNLRVDDLDQRSSVRFAAALFSWGDVAKDAIFRDDESDEIDRDVSAGR